MTVPRGVPQAILDRDGPVRPRRRWVTWAIGASVLMMVVMWVYAFGFASKKGLYRVDSDAWRSNAQTVCSVAQTERAALANTQGGLITNPTDDQLRQHADLVDDATDILQRMVDDVVAFPVETSRDRDIIVAWEGHYRTLIADRRAYTDRARSLDWAPYSETLLETGGPVSNIITDFTSGNDVKACAPPGELPSQ
jgi:hypothetical protein